MLSKTFSSLLLLSTLTFANTLEESILNEDRLKIFELEQNKNIEDSNKLKKDWVNTATYTLSKEYSDGYDSTKSIIAINQPIFKSGGIYSAIKYAKSLKKYNDLDIKARKIAMIKDAVNILFEIESLNINIEKQKLMIRNAEIDIERKKEQVLNGVLDTSFLDNAILDANNKRNTLSELYFNKQSLINNFRNYSEKEYTNYTLPKLQFLRQQDYIEKNIDLKKQDEDIETKDNYKGVIRAKYLPSLNFNYRYTKTHESESPMSNDDGYTYGLSVVVPLDIRVFNDIESSKVDYLKAKVQRKIQENSEINFYKTTMDKIEMYNKKIELAKSDVLLYDSLIEQMKELVFAQLKIQSDVDTLINSRKIKILEIKNYNINKQTEILNLYSKIAN